jgi:hypothetical protein
VLAELSTRFEIVLDALERDPHPITNRVVPGRVILGELGGIETGIRQLRRSRPLETEEVRLPDGTPLVVPTPEEMLRVKAYLVVKRNQVRDYLDVAALSEQTGLSGTARALSAIDDYYSDLVHDEGPVAAQLADQLADPQPRDSRALRHLAGYKGLAPHWTDWSAVVAQCQAVSDAMLDDGR